MTALAPNESGVSTLHVLVVDEDPSICAIYDQVLRSAGYDVATATSRETALAALDRLGRQVDVLVVDANLPDTAPTDLTREIVRKIGLRPTLYVSAWAEEFLDLVDAPGQWCVLRLPAELSQFVEAIEWLTGRGPRPTGFSRH